MTRFRQALHKQGHLILNHDLYAWAAVVLFAAIPFFVWLSVALVAFITLRKGPTAGIKALSLGIIALSSLSWTTRSLGTVLGVLLTYLPCFIAAYVLRQTVNIRMAINSLLLLACLLLAVIHWIYPEYIEVQYQFVRLLFKEFNYDGALTSWLDNATGQSNFIAASYVLGAQILSHMLSAVSSLVLARSFQAMLFNPGGCREEITHYRASQWSLILLVYSLWGFTQQVGLAVSLLPVLVVYFAGAGLSFGLFLLGNKLKRGILLVSLVTLIFFPVIMLPLYVLVGVLDSIINFRSHFMRQMAPK